MSIKWLGCILLSTVVVGAVGILEPSTHAVTTAPENSQLSKSTAVQIAQTICPGSNPQVGSRTIDIYPSDASPNPSGRQLLPGTTITLTGQSYGSGDARRLQFSNPSPGGWVLAIGLVCSNTPPTPPPNRPSLTVRACGVVAYLPELQAPTRDNPDPRRERGLTVWSSPRSGNRLRVLYSGAGVVLSTESYRRTGGNTTQFDERVSYRSRNEMDYRDGRRVITRIIRPNNFPTAQGQSWWVYESGEFGPRSGFNIEERPCSQLFQGVVEGRPLSL